MIKNKTFYLLPIVLVIFTFFVSCRNEILAEDEARNQAELPKITSKIISLSNSKHKQKLLLELDDAMNKLTNSGIKSANLFGKNVAFGDSIIVDTENVIMMENGSNYHSYTFNINRTTSTSNTPVENILFTPLLDGSYQGYWIVYDLTESEKLKISNGEFVNVKNKTKITKLENISLSSLSKSSGACTSSYYYPTLCIEKKHLPDKPCAYIGTSGEAQWIQVIIDNCEPEYNVIAASPVDGSNGGGGPNDGTETPPDDPCVTSAANPGEVGVVNGEGCNIGAPTQPNLGNTRFTNYINTLSPNLKTFINSQNNSAFFTLLSSYFFDNNQTQDAKDFIFWAIQFKIDNPSITIAEFENWFMGNAEIENIENIDPNSIVYETPIQQQPLPSLINWNSNFPKIEQNGYWTAVPSPDVYQLAGGSIYNSHLNDTNNAYQNACAIRGSRGLLYSGINIPVIKISGNPPRQLTQKGGDNKNYILAATSFEKYMIDTFGDTSNKLEGASANDPTIVANFLKGKSGIFVIINNSTSLAGYSGHVDNIVDGICISGAYTQPKGGVKSIRVWVLN